jgi:hypothetical protein
MILNVPIKMYFIPQRTTGGHLGGLLVLMLSLLGLTPVQAQPTIASTVPTSGATGVSTTTAVVFTFSEAMDPNFTEASFFNFNTFVLLPTTPVWSGGNTGLTCTPSPAFPASTPIFWVVNGQNPAGTALGGNPSGTFTTGTGGGGSGGSGTNQYTTFSVGKAISYNQTSTGAPTPDTILPYLFLGSIVLSSNRTLVSATLTLPSASVSNLTQNPLRHELFVLSVGDANQSTIDNTFGNGNYTFNAAAASSNQQVTVNFPATLTQPNAPHTTSYTAAQAVNPAQPFTLGWDAFTPGTATDFVYVVIGNDFSTPEPGAPNSLPGSATSVQIPANSLQPNTTYDASISFYRVIYNTNNSGYSTAAFRDSVTHFSLITTSGTLTPLILTNASWSSRTFSFDVTSAAGQSLIIQYNMSFASNQWQTLLTTNSATGRVRVSDSLNTSNSHLIYRARTGP